jgi:hypothetical protein
MHRVGTQAEADRLTNQWAQGVRSMNRMAAAYGAPDIQIVDLREQP